MIRDPVMPAVEAALGAFATSVGGAAAYFARARSRLGTLAVQ